MGSPQEPSVSGSCGERTSKGAERSFPRQGEAEQSGLCEDAAGPVLAYGIGASVIYGLILWVVGLF